MSAEMGFVAAGPVHQDGRVKQLTTANAFPGIEGTNIIIEFLSEHTALAAWALHKKHLPIVINKSDDNGREYFIKHANKNLILPPPRVMSYDLCYFRMLNV